MARSATVNCTLERRNAQARRMNDERYGWVEASVVISRHQREDGGVRVGTACWTIDDDNPDDERYSRAMARQRSEGEKWRVGAGCSWVMQGRIDVDFEWTSACLAAKCLEERGAGEEILLRRDVLDRWEMVDIPHSFAKPDVTADKYHLLNPQYLPTPYVDCRAAFLHQSRSPSGLDA